MLGPLSRQEVVTIAGLVVLLLGLIFQPLLHIDSGWLAPISLVVILAGGALDRESFRTSIEWGFLILFGVLLGTGGYWEPWGSIGGLATRWFLSRTRRGVRAS